MSDSKAAATTHTTAMLIASFIAAYLVASWLDLWTTAWALQRPEAAEANSAVVQNGAYVASRAWLVTGAGGLFLTAYFAFGALNAHQIADRWLQRPMLSFLSLRSNPLFSLPWLRSVIDRSPLHALAISTAFVALRLLAAVNNALIALFGDGPLSMSIRTIGSATSPLVGVLITVGCVYVALSLLATALISHQIRKVRSSRL